MLMALTLPAPMFLASIFSVVSVWFLPRHALPDLVLVCVDFGLHCVHRAPVEYDARYLGFAAVAVAFSKSPPFHGRKARACLKLQESVEFVTIRVPHPRRAKRLCPA